ncbi:replicative DNA helicase [Azotobacter bryophylli]|uniref:DNA 5'-3' helicase n=1 Tax=Azotobacter bryophylli TaxID=1986537 RepID=A0ABV7AZS4_9GAMM
MRVDLYSEESEYGVIGAMLLQAELIEAVTERLVVGDFYDPVCQELFQLIRACHEQSLPVDVVTLSEQKPMLACGERTLFVAGTIASNTPSTANWETYAKIVKQRSVARKVVAAADQIKQRMEEGLSLDEVLAFGQQAWVELEAEGTTARKEYRFIGEILPAAVDGIDARFNRQVILGHDTGLTDLDGLVPGLCPGHLVVVGGLPGLGKTTLGLGFAERIAVQHQRPALVFSLEMTDVELVNRSIAAAGTVPLKRINEGHSLEDGDWTGITSAVSRLKDAPLIICDDASLTLRGIRRIARSVKREYGLDVVVIDYIGLIEADQKSGSRYQDVTEISRGIKRLAKELAVPIVLLAQLNRGSTSRPGKKPTKSDLRDSGQIEADADIVILVHRDMESEAGQNGVTELIVDKNRHGPVGSCFVQHQGAYHRFVNLAGPREVSQEEVEMGRTFASKFKGRKTA